MAKKVNKVMLGSQTIMDVTDATASAGDIVEGKSAYVADGTKASGTLGSKAAASGGADLSLVTTGEKYTWNNKSDFSGSYNDLSNKPTIPVKALWVDMGTISSLPVTKNVSGCQTDMVCAKAELGTPSAQTGTWTINTDTAGKVTVSGTISGSTTLKLLLVQETSVTAS